jgi:hypothetical protein
MIVDFGFLNWKMEDGRWKMEDEDGMATKSTRNTKMGNEVIGVSLTTGWRSFLREIF